MLLRKYLLKIIVVEFVVFLSLRQKIMKDVHNILSVSECWNGLYFSKQINV